jgi:hypothetical protein
MGVNRATGQKNKSFMEMIQSAKVGNAEEDDLDDEEEFVLKKEPSTTATTAHRGIVSKSLLGCAFILMLL